MSWMKSRSGLIQKPPSFSRVISAKAVRVRYIILRKDLIKMAKLMSLAYRSEN